VSESVDILIRGLGHLRDVARATLDQNRLDRSGARLVPEDFDDLRVLISAETTRQQQDLGWNVTVKSAALADYPSAPVRQIALNLLLNATEAAGRNGKVALAVCDGESGLRLEVSDSGKGLSEAACARLLGSGPVPHGGGVGLRLVHDLVRALKGHISLQRDEGLTVIRIDLPPQTAEAV
jgi:signal transduction histidine kinase